MQLQPEINMFIFLRGCMRLQPITMPESVWAWSTSCGIIVYCYFYVFRLINKGSYAIKWQLTICFKSSKPIQIGLCMLMSFSIHLHGLHLDTQCGQTWHLSTQLCSGLVIGFCGQPHYYYRPYYPTAMFRSPSSYMISDEPFPDMSCTNWVSPNHLPAIVASDRSWTTLLTRAH